MKNIAFFLLLSSVSFAQEEKKENLIQVKEGNSNYSNKSPKEICEALRLRVLEGELFTTIAQQYSEDPGSSVNGGLYQNVTKGMMVQEFEENAFKLKVGEISEVFETQYGFHFLQVQEIRGEKRDVRHVLIKNK
ncbi:MAG: peptidylprolyl isomerase [Sphingobacteriaceae bacterium]|nr:peptidylprolyl isomerase [Sphingobacteriaceae bacterium]